MIEIELISSGKAETLCRKITADLPEYFGLPECNEHYALGVHSRKNFAARIGEEQIALLSLEFPYPKNANIYWMAILREFQGQGVGRMLLEAACHYAKGQGAALAFGASEIVQVSILFTIFLRAKNREQYGTGNFRFKKKEFIRCIKVGGPNAVAFGVGIAAWAFFNDLVASTGILYMTALAICQNYFFLFYFFTEGMGKAISTITANLIGAKRPELVPKLLLSAIKLHGIFICVLAIPLVFYSKPFINIFLDNNASAQGIVGLYEMADDAMTWIWGTIVFNGIFWIFMAQLTAAGDTKFLMYLNMISSWTFLMMPAYVLIDLLGYSPTLAWRILLLNVVVMSLFVFLRYRSGKWRKFNIID